MLVLMKTGTTANLPTIASIPAKVESLTQVGSAAGLHRVMLMLMAENRGEDIFPCRLKVWPIWGQRMADMGNPFS